MTLAQRLAAQIARNGPITLAEYMAACLFDPAEGYYATREPFGAEGDFVTAPEISQMFGELLGLALAQAWLDQGAPSPVALVELGPGRGTLMADILRATARVPGLAKAAQVHLVEASPRLREMQARAIGRPARWHGSAADLPRMSMLLVANEFFDALPIRQFVRQAEGWSERVVALDDDGRLTLALTPPAPLTALDHRLADTQVGDVVEICPSMPAIVAEIAGRIASHGGAGLIVDYGGWHGLGDTFQAVKAHAPVDPLAHPGEADLTAHVDFEPLAAAARQAGAATSPLVPQGVFLERLGIAARAEALATRLSGRALQAHLAAHRRLTHPEEMGSLFKVLGLRPRGAPALPGLESADGERARR